MDFYSEAPITKSGFDLKKPTRPLPRPQRSLSSPGKEKRRTAKLVLQRVDPAEKKKAVVFKPL